jgi:hypothetical protein
MKIFGILLVKNEADIIQASIEDASRWADRIFILDNGSTDGTWEIVKNLESDIVRPWKQDFRPYSNGLRAEVFNQFRHEAQTGDWWCYKLDSDEFYVDDPREFLANVPKRFHVVAKKSLKYRITPEDLEEHRFTGRFEEDVPFIRYIEPVCTTESRFFRYREKLTWLYPQDRPVNMGIRYPGEIIVKHYQQRSPQQMQARLDSRNSIPKDERGKPFRHVTQTRWQELLANRNELVLDTGSYDLYTSLEVWKRPDMKPLKRIKKYILHRLKIYP